jgi:copper oxidase (laccase) domain-containing protein
MKFDNVEILVSTVKDGNMSEKWGEKEEVTKNRNNFLEKYGIRFEDCIKMSLLSGTEINEVTGADKNKWIEGDGIITTEKNLPIWLVVADCFPVVFWNDKYLGIVHIGWRGMEGKLINKMIARMGNDLKVWIGPGIRDKEYWWKNKDEVKKSDLVKYIRNQILESGIKEENIIDSGIDVVSDLNYFSHHRVRQTGEVEGRFAIAVRYCADSSR